MGESLGIVSGITGKRSRVDTEKVCQEEINSLSTKCSIDSLLVEDPGLPIPSRHTTGSFKVCEIHVRGEIRSRKQIQQYITSSDLSYE